MARRKLIWHLGLADPARTVVAANLETHQEALTAYGAQVAASVEESRLATHELLRTHREAGLSRSEVEGRWARICDRVWQHKGVSLLSTPDLSGADKDQIRLALDPLIGLEVHLVVTLDSFSQQIYGGWLAGLREGGTTGWEKYAGRVLASPPEHAQAERFWASHDLTAVLARWGWTFREERLHVVASTDVADHWTQFLDVAGVPLPGLDPVLPAYADPAGVAVLRKVNRQLEGRLGRSSVSLLTEVDREAAAMPVVPTGALAGVAEAWTSALSSSDHDLRGDLAALVDDGEPTPMPGPRDQLGAAVETLADALAENSALRASVAALEADHERLERKRRKLKRKLERSASSPQK